MRRKSCGLIAAAVSVVAAMRIPPRLMGGAEPGQHIARELLQEACLIGARRVEYELVEAEVDVRRDPLDDLVGVVGDDEARARPIAVLVREALHLDRVLDARLLLPGERERRPPSAGFLGVGA